MQDVFFFFFPLVFIWTEIQLNNQLCIHEHVSELSTASIPVHCQGVLFLLCHSFLGQPIQNVDFFFVWLVFRSRIWSFT